MNKIEQLIQQLCPEGVEEKELGQIGYFYGGLSGKSKEDFQDGNAKFITYKNIYSNISLNTDIDDRVKIEENEKQNIIEYGDVLFTGSSETPDECGMSSVLTERISEPLYLNSFCFGFRLNDKELFLPDFLKHLFRADNIRNQIAQTASGVTRFNVSKKRFAKVEIPIPPIPIQQEIVNILDKFTRLEAELEAELEARKKQYEYYRNQLLTPIVVSGKWLMNNVEVEWKMLGEVTYYPKGRIPSTEIDKTNYVGVDNLLQNKQGKFDSNYVPSSGNLIEYKNNDVLIGNIRPYLKKIWLATNNGGTNGDVIVVRINENNNKEISPRFLYFLLSSDKFFDYDMQFAKGAKMPRGNKDAILKYKIPIPPLSEQNRIVEILDRFDALVNDISVGLPAEIEARRKQYEYYRGKLLDFEKLDTKEPLLSHCRYYKGEQKCPKSIEDKDMANIWQYEKMWVERSDLHDEKEYNSTEYLNYGLKDFEANDGTPLTLKALLFNRFCHWVGGYGVDDDIKNFKEWYFNFYIRKAEPK